MSLTAYLWGMKNRPLYLAARINRMLYDRTWHRGNRSKTKTLTDEERDSTWECPLCGAGREHQLHILYECGHPVMTAIRQHGLQCINDDINEGCSHSTAWKRPIYRAFQQEWNTTHETSADIWVGRLRESQCTRFATILLGDSYVGDSTTLKKVLKNQSRPLYMRYMPRETHYW